MGNVHMEATQINYREGNKKMSVAEAIKNAGNTGLAHTADIAPEFSATSAYNAGDFVYKDGTLYQFTVNHAAGAWSTDDTQAVTVGEKITSLSGDVSDLSGQKANQITIAPFFSAETAYDPGDLVYYNGLSYRCVNSHEGEWDADDFAATTVANELSSLMSGLTNAVTGTAAMQSDHTITEAVLSRCGMLYIGYFNITLTSAVSAWANFAHIEANLKYTTLCYAVSGGSNKIVYCTTGGNVQTTQALESGATLHIVLCAVANFN